MNFTLTRFGSQLAIALLLPVVTLMADVPETPEFLLQQADKAFDAYDFDTAEDLYEQARQRARDAGNLSVEIEATSQRARTFLTQHEIDSAKVWLEKAEAIATPDYPSGWARYLGVKGRWQWRNDKIQDALSTFAEMHDFAAKNRLNTHEIDAARMAAIVAPLEEQEEWALKAIERAEKTDNEKYLGPLWNNLGGSYLDLKRHEDAVEAYKKAREYHWRYGTEMNKFWADYSVGYALRYTGKFDEAMSWLNPCLAWAERMENHAAMGHTSEQIGEIALAQGDTTRCLMYFKSALDHYIKANYAEHSASVIEEMEKRIAELE